VTGYSFVSDSIRNSTFHYTQLLYRRNEHLNSAFHSCTVHLDTIEFFIYSTDAQLDCSKNVKVYIKIYMRRVPTCFGFLQSLSRSYCMCFAKAISINNPLKYVIYIICSV
jgi:hypothetical protein